MQIKAFTLIEVLISILLLSILFALVLNGYIYKTKNQVMTFQDKFLKNLDNNSKKLIIYGQNCKKAIIIKQNGDIQKVYNLKFSKSDTIYKRDNYGELKPVSYDLEKIDNKFQKVCFEIRVNKGKFLDKLILKREKKSYIFIPIFQEILEFDNFEKAKETLFTKTPFPVDSESYKHE